jgi:hypothetical protein
MSTDSPAQPFGAASLLESLPSEIIEKILLEVVDYVEPVIEYFPGYGKVLREPFNDSRVSGVTCQLAHRLVSRTLYDNSWRAFAKVIGHTIFDIRSKESVTNLSMLANEKQLTPWIQRLTISCFTPGDRYINPSESNPSTDHHHASIELFQHIRTDKQDWFPAAWRWAHSEDPISSTQALAITAEAQDLIELLSGHLRLLNNVIEIQYHYVACCIPARFRQCIRQEWVGVPTKLCIGSSIDGLRGCVLGLHILVEAMAAAQMAPQRLDIAGQVQDPHGFFALTPCERFKKITHKVENLALRNDVEHLHWEDGPPPTGSWVAITAENFPALRSLQLDMWSSSRGDHGTSTPPLPQPSDVPRLTDLTLVDVPDWEPLLLDFVQLFRDSLKSITLKKLFRFYDKPLIELMCDLGFDSFTLGKGTITGTKN